MKKIQLKTLEDPKSQLPVVEYREVLKTVVSRPLDPQKGADITEMRESIRLLDALDAADGTLRLEDADYNLLTMKLKAFPWNVIDRRILQLIDDINNASELPQLAQLGAARDGVAEAVT